MKKYRYSIIITVIVVIIIFTQIGIKNINLSFKNILPGLLIIGVITLLKKRKH